ncbi:hypothetical protein NPIL_395941 [Nephila pilipes]|uniref:Uncharacterized protein n=1 Tax=Nephila pilipes TaxID=299642 RepID=A0A8X6N7M2_NEPPI|nr:hypothetical protein NPIL_395941 [Nephila pilipes]
MGLLSLFIFKVRIAKIFGQLKGGRNRTEADPSNKSARNTHQCKCNNQAISILPHFIHAPTPFASDSLHPFVAKAVNPWRASCICIKWSKKEKPSMSNALLMGTCKFHPKPSAILNPKRKGYWKSGKRKFVIKTFPPPLRTRCQILNGNC